MLFKYSWILIMKYSTCRVKKLKIHDWCTVLPSELADGWALCATGILRKVNTNANGKVFYMNSMSIGMPQAKWRKQNRWSYLSNTFYLYTYKLIYELCEIWCSVKVTKKTAGFWDVTPCSLKSVLTLQSNLAKKDWSQTSTSPHAFMVCWLVHHRGNFTFTSNFRCQIQNCLP